jgi:hypothetical protein
MTFTSNRAGIPIEWRRFLQGVWQKEMPNQKPGKYPVATRDGELAGEIWVWKHENSLIAAKKWEGWWWSEPMPYLNRPVKKWNEC